MPGPRWNWSGSIAWLGQCKLTRTCVAWWWGSLRDSKTTKVPGGPGSPHAAETGDGSEVAAAFGHSPWAAVNRGQTNMTRGPAVGGLEKPTPPCPCLGTNPCRCAQSLTAGPAVRTAGAERRGAAQACCDVGVAALRGWVDAQRPALLLARGAACRRQDAEALDGRLTQPASQPESPKDGQAFVVAALASL